MSTTVEVSHPRCPFCHDVVDPESEQLACVSCRAWHHQSCWREGGETCCACGASAPRAGRVGLARLYFGASVGSCVLVSGSGAAALYWGAELPGLISLLLGLAGGALAGLAAATLQSRIVGFDPDTELQEELKAITGDVQSADVKAGLRSMLWRVLGFLAAGVVGAAAGVGLEVAGAPSWLGMTAAIVTFFAIRLSIDGVLDRRERERLLAALPRANAPVAESPVDSEAVGRPKAKVKS